LCDFISRSSFLFHWSYVGFVPVPSCFYGIVIPPMLLFLLRIAFDIQDFLFFHMNFRINFLFLGRMTLRFWWALHWICRLLSIVQPFSWYEFYQSMNIGSLSNFWFFLWFLSSRFCSFHYRGLSPPWLNLYLGIFLFWDYCEWDYFPDFFLSLLLVCTNFCMSILCPATITEMFIRCRNVLVESFRCKIMSSTTKDIGLLPSLFDSLFISYSCPIALVGILILFWVRVRE
jgi:hypothetical protein